MFKKILLLAIAPLALLASSAFAEEDVLNDLAGLKASAITDAVVSIDDGLANLDIDGLSQQAGTEKSTDAIEACFRRFGYGGYGGYCNYGYSYWNYGCYGHSYYQPFYVYRPVYYTTYYQPICYRSYWGCY